MKAWPRNLRELGLVFDVMRIKRMDLERSTIQRYIVVRAVGGGDRWVCQHFSAVIPVSQRSTVIGSVVESLARDIHCDATGLRGDKRGDPASRKKISGGTDHVRFHAPKTLADRRPQRTFGARFD